jgi:hypothetical protein
MAAKYEALASTLRELVDTLQTGRVHEVLTQIERTPVSVDVLKASRIGVTISKLLKHKNEALRVRGRTLRSKYQRQIKLLNAATPAKAVPSAAAATAVARDEFDDADLPALDCAALDAAVATAERQHLKRRRVDSAEEHGAHRAPKRRANTVQLDRRTRLDYVIDERCELVRTRGECETCLGLFREEPEDADWEARFRNVSNRRCYWCQKRLQAREAPKRSFEFNGFAQLLQRAAALGSAHAETVHAACVAKAVMAVVQYKATRAMFAALDIPPDAWRALERAFAANMN